MKSAVYNTSSKYLHTATDKKRIKKYLVEAIKSVNKVLLLKISRMQKKVRPNKDIIIKLIKLRLKTLAMCNIDGKV